MLNSAPAGQTAELMVAGAGLGSTQRRFNLLGSSAFRQSARPARRERERWAARVSTGCSGSPTFPEPFLALFSPNVRIPYRGGARPAPMLHRSPAEPSFCSVMSWQSACVSVPAATCCARTSRTFPALPRPELLAAPGNSGLRTAGKALATWALPLLPIEC